MKQIQKWGLSKLHNEECFGFLKFVKSAKESLPKESTEEPDGPDVQSASILSTVGASPALTAAEDAFDEKFEQFDASLENSKVNPAVAEANELDAQRDTLWRLANSYAKVMAQHPTESVAQSSSKVRDIFVKYGDPTYLAQSEETGVLHNLLADIDALESEDKTQSGIQPWYDKLSSVQAEFEDADSRRAQIAGAKTAGVVKQARKEAEAAYKDLVKVVNALVIINGDEPYSEFIDQVNAQMERQSQILNRRDTINAKKDDNSSPDDGPVVQ